MVLRINCVWGEAVNGLTIQRLGIWPGRAFQFFSDRDMCVPGVRAAAASYNCYAMLRPNAGEWLDKISLLCGRQATPNGRRVKQRLGLYKW